MPVATIRGVDIHYEILGERGPFVALQPGGRRAGAGVRSLGEKIAEAGYRVIGYSRRGYINSAPFDKSNPGIGSADLHNLVDFLGVRKFHLVASAAGGSIASDYAFTHPDRLYSLTISSNSFGVRDGEIAKAATFIRPKGWDDMPAEFRELGPSYRAANPDGVKAWMEKRPAEWTG